MCAETAVRPAAVGDLAAVVGLLAQLAPGWRREGDDVTPPLQEADRSTWREILATEHRMVLVALRGDAVVGVVDVVIVPSLLDGVVPHATVDALVVDDEVRGEGIGRALMAEVHTRAEALGCCRLELLSSKGLDRAHAFYSALGYEAAAEGLRINLPAPVPASVE